MKQNGLAPILIILLIALAVGGYFIYQKQPKLVSTSQPSPSPVASSEASNSAEAVDWKTYTLNFSSFKYPSSVYLDQLTSNDNSVTIYSKDPRKYKDDIYYLGISEDKGKWESYVEMQKEFNDVNVIPVKLSSLQVYELIGLPKPGGVSEDTYVFNGESGFITIRIGNIPSDSKTNQAFILFRNTIDQILSTFKFTQ